jgi:hypothetical protein
MTNQPTDREIENEKDRHEALSGVRPSTRVATAGIIAQRNRLESGDEPPPADRTNALRQRRWREKNALKHKDARRHRYLMTKYGITGVDYDAALSERDGKCDICQNPQKTEEGRLFVDHDHETGRVRGLLCVGCSSALGKFGDTADGIRRALAYIENPPGL